MSSNILIITAVFPPEPVVSAILSFDIVNNLIVSGFKVTVLHPICTRPYGFVFQKFKNSIVGYNNVVLNSYTCPRSKILGRLYESYSFGRHCCKYIKEHQKEIICIYINSWPLFSQALIVKIAQKYNIPCIIHVQDIYPESFTNKMKIGRVIANHLLLSIDKFILSKANHIVAISSNMKKYLMASRNINAAKISIVENWQNEERFINYHCKERLKDKDKDEYVTFMYLGNNGPVAGVELLITCFAIANIPNTKLVIAGSGSRKVACMELAKTHSNVEIEFWDVPDGKVPEIQDQADVMLLPVKKGAAMSSIPSKLPAYMFSKKPIIASLDVGSDTAKAIYDADCGIVVEPENVEKLVRALKNAADWSEDIKKQKGYNGFEYAMKRFSKNHNLPLIINIIKKYV